MEQGHSPEQSAPSDQLIQDIEHAHEIASQADDLLGRGGHPLGANPETEEVQQRHHEVTAASELAQTYIEHQQSFESAPGIAIAGASMLAPQLEVERRDAERAALTDDLTGLPNNRAFSQALPAAESDPGTSIISFDGDNFSPLNKLHGNAAGDVAIIELARAIRDAAAEFGSNRVFRPGGDEFYVLAPPAVAADIIASAQRRLRQRIESGEPFSTATGDKYPASLYSELGVSGESGPTRIEADLRMQETKAARKQA